ncbi:hypothetical protein VUR80DRAFT_2641 [Thermomyces stellatus]
MPSRHRTSEPWRISSHYGPSAIGVAVPSWGRVADESCVEGGAIHLIRRRRFQTPLVIFVDAGIVSRPLVRSRKGNSHASEACCSARQDLKWTAPHRAESREFRCPFQKAVCLGQSELISWPACIHVRQAGSSRKCPGVHVTCRSLPAGRISRPVQMLWCQEVEGT